MNRENQPQLTDQVVELEKYLVEVKGLKKIADHLEEPIEYTSN
jgi:hypothetical protein